MSALRLMGKWSVPVATAVAVPLFGPAVFADSGSKDAAKTTTPTSRMIRPSELPMYEEPEEVLDFEYHGRERTSLEETVGSVRHEIEGILEATRSTRERVVHICETGKAHTMASVDLLKELQMPEATVDMLKSLQSLQDEENMLPRVGAITIGGLAGLVLGARKKGGLAKKAMYTSVGVTAAASLCYPRQAYQISQQAYGTAKEYANIGYNFVAGVKPQSKVAVPEEPKKEPPAEPIPEAEASASPETPPAETAPAESEGGEVRSVLPHAIPDKKFPGSVDSLAQQASDVMQWGFRLTDKDSSAPSVSLADVVPPAKSSVLEGFGAVGEAESHGIVGAAEQVTVPKEPSQQTKETEGPDTIHEIVEKFAEDIAEKVGEDIVENVAVVVKEVAEETLESVGEVAQVADLVENVTDKVSSTIDVIQDVLEAADKAAEEAGVPDTLIDVAEAVVEGVEIVVDTVNVIAGKVEEVAESVVKEIEDLKAEAVDLVEDEGKREELVDKIIDYLSESTAPGTADADQVQKPEEVSQEKELDLKESRPEDMLTLPEPIGEVTEPIPSEIEPVTEVIEPVVEIIEPVTEVTEPVVEVVGPITEKKEETTETVEQDVKQVSESVEPEKDVSEVSAKSAPEGETVSSGKEQIKPSIEDKGPVPVEKPSLLDNLLSLFRKDKGDKMIKEEAVALPDKEEAGKPEPESLVAEEVLPVFEKLAEDIVKKAAEPLVEEVAEVVAAVSKEVEKEAEVIAETAKVVEKTGEETAKCAEVIEGVAEAADKAAKDVPGVPEIVEEIAEKIDEVAKESEAVIDTVVAVAEKVEELAKEIVQEAKAIELAAAELVESEEKREGLIENVIEFVSEKLSGDSPVEEVQIVVPETPVEADKVALGIELAPLVEENVEAAVPVKKEGLFDKLVNLFKDKPATDEESFHVSEEVKELADKADKILKPSDDEGEKKLTEEGVSKSDEKGEVLEPSEPVEEQKPTEVVITPEAPVDAISEVPVEGTPVVLVDTTPEVPVDTTPETPASIEAETLPEALVEETAEAPIQAVQEELPVQKVEESIANIASETQRKEGGLIGRLIDFFSKDEKAPLSEQFSVKEEETLQAEVVAAPVAVVAVESAPEVSEETPPEVTVDITPEIPVDTPTEVLVEATAETPPVQAEPEELPVQKTDESIVESVPETPPKEGGLIHKLIDLFSYDEKTSHSEQVAGKDEETSQTELVTAPVEVESVPEVPAETPPEVPMDITPEIPEPEELAVQKMDESVVESVLETPQKEGGLIGKLIDFFSDDEKTSHSEQVAGKDEETLQTELVTAPVDVAEVGSVPEIPAETPPEVPAETPPEVPAETPPDVPVDITPEIPVDTSSEVFTGAETLAEVPAVETNAEAPPIQAEPEVLPVQKSDESVVEAAPETSRREGGLIGKLIDFFSDDEKTSQSEQVLGKEETSQTELVTEPLGVAEEKPADSEVKVAEPAGEPQVDEKDQAEEQVTKVEEPSSETGVEPKESVPEQELPVSVKDAEEVIVLNQEGKVGLIDKLVNLFSSDKESDAAAETVTEQQVKEEEPIVPEVELKEPAVEVTVTEEETASPVIAQQEEAVAKELEQMPSLEEPVSHIEPVEVKEIVEGGLVGKLIGLFSKSEEKSEDTAVLKQTPEIEETPEKASDDKVADEMDFVIVEHSDVTEDKNVDPSDATAQKVTVDESTGITESKDFTSDDSGKSGGLIDKLLTFMSSTKEKETTDMSEAQEVPDVKQEIEVEPEPEVAESPSDGKVEEAKITPKTDAAEMPFVPPKGSGGLFSSLGGLFTKEKSEAVESTSNSSDKPDEKVIEDSTLSETVIAGPEAPTLEVKDKSLFDKIAEMISSNEKTPEDIKDETLGSTTRESQTEPSQEELPQQAPAVEDDQQKPLSGSSETEAKPSLFDRVTSLFSKESEDAPIDKEPTVKEESTEGLSSPDSKTATSEDDADVFVVLSKPTTPVETSPPEESQKEAEKATGWLQGSWLRSSASVSKEGKDVIIQVAPETPEKDYGQSNPDDADMYTTRN